MKNIDIDDYPNYCIDPVAREFIYEAVNAYKAGAYRATITYTWIAIVLNLNTKIDQLAIIGDKEAIVLKENIDKIRQRNDIPAMLLFEREILRTVKDKFELFDGIVYLDLCRIQEDRNRCSHPLLHFDDKPYSPTPEQAKNHLKIAISKLLSEENVFGKSSLDKILELINSDVFPLKTDDIERVLDGSYLSRPKSTLIRNLLIVLIKDFLRKNMDYREKSIKKNVIRYLIKKQRSTVEKNLLDKLNDLCNYNDQNELSKMSDVLTIDNLIWENIAEDKRILIREFVKSFPTIYFEYINNWLELDYLKEETKFRIKNASREDIIRVHSSFFMIPDEICNRMLTLYLESPNFETANSFAHVISSSILDIGKERISKLLKGINENGQISSSWELKTVINSIKKSNFFKIDELNEMLKDNNLSEYIEVPF